MSGRNYQGTGRSGGREKQKITRICLNNKKRHKGPERYSETKRNTCTSPNMRYKCRYINEAHTYVLKITEWGKREKRQRKHTKVK